MAADLNYFIPEKITKLKSKKRQLQEKQTILEKKIKSIDRTIYHEVKKYIVCTNCGNWILKSSNKDTKTCHFCKEAISKK